MPKSIVDIDKILTKRIYEYMQLDDDGTIHPDAICEHLMTDYKKDYGRRKQVDFKNIVGKIYTAIKTRKEKGAFAGKPVENSSAVMNESNGAELNPEFDMERTEDVAAPPTPDNNQSTEANLDTIGYFGNAQDNIPKTNDNGNNSDSSELEITGSTPGMPASIQAIRSHVPHASTQFHHRMPMSQQNANPNNFQFPPSGQTNGLQQRRSLIESIDKRKRPTTRSKINPGNMPKKRTRRQSKNRKSKNDDKSSASDSSGSDSDDEKKEFSITSQKSEISLKDDVVLPKNTREHLQKVLESLKHKNLFEHLNVQPPKGILIDGPAGCGKTMLSKAICNELNANFYYISATELMAGVAGGSEKRIRKIFQMANSTENQSVIIFDEFEIIGGSGSGAGKALTARIISQLCSSIDENSNSLVIGCTSKLHELDVTLRRPGRFDYEFTLRIPNEDARLRMLQNMTKHVKTSNDVDLPYNARMTPGFVGSDLDMLLREAAQFCVSDHLKSKKDLEREKSAENEVLEINATNIAENGDSVENGEPAKTNDQTEKPASKHPRADKHIVFDDDPMNDDYNPGVVIDDTPEEPVLDISIKQKHFLEAIDTVVPASKREGFACVPDITWDDIGGVQKVREELRMAIVSPVRYPHIFASFGQTKPPGVLLVGPPGNGKTLLAKAVANESGLNFIAVNGPELLNMYVGESERAVRSVFSRARHSSPCVIFFDEIDALCPKRQSSKGGGNEYSARLVNQMLTEMDGISSVKTSSEDDRVFVMAATNRPDMLDAALTRPGRLDKKLYVGLPNNEGIVSIIKALTRNKPKVNDQVDIDALAKDTRFAYLSGADIASVVREASMHAMRKELKRCLELNKHILLGDNTDTVRLDINSS